MKRNEPPAQPTRRLSRPEAQHMLGVSEKTLSRWVKAGRLTQTRVGLRRVYYDLAEVERLLRGEQ